MPAMTTSATSYASSDARLAPAGATSRSATALAASTRLRTAAARNAIRRILRAGPTIRAQS
jgi:hypothetical protein